MRNLVLALAALTVPAVAQAPMQKPGSADVKRVVAGTYKADPGHTLVRWTVDHLGFSPYFGLFGDVTGTLTLDPARLAQAKVDVTIPVSKVLTASEGLTKHLLRGGKDGKADFFGANPADARFVSTKVTPNGETARIDGMLTLNGVTKPVTLAARFYGAGRAPAMMGGRDTIGFTATTTIKRSDFGVAYGIPLVSDEVALDITAAFERTG